MRRILVSLGAILGALSLVACSSSKTEDTGDDAATDTGTPPDDTGGDSGGGSDADAAVGDGIEVTATGAKAVPNGGTYKQVTLDGIPPYSDGIADLTITNVSGGALTVHSITLTPVGTTEAIEWTLNTPGSTSKKPITISEKALAKDEQLTFGLYFFPLTSGQRDLQVTISYGAGKSYTFTVQARGRDNATFSPVVSNAFEKIFGKSNVAASNSFEVGALKADAAGNIFMNGNVNGWHDKFGKNLALAKVNADGSLGWVRELQQSLQQESRDIGENGELGGGQDSVAVDATGNAYIAARRDFSSTRFGDCLVQQVDASTGAFKWARMLNLDTAEGGSIAAKKLSCQAVDASLSDRVLVSGQVADSGGAFVIALKKSDGSLLWARTFTLGGVHRVGEIVVDATNKRVYVGGIANAKPFAARLDAVDGTTPTLAWARTYALSLDNIHGLALDGDGLLAAFDRRGATTYFTVGRLATSDGAVVWSKTWDAAGSAKNRAEGVALYKGAAVFSGRIGFAPFDTGGDGFLLALDPATGSYKWASFYYTGKGAEEIESTDTTSLVATSAGLWALHYVTPGANNHKHFWGRWYQANDNTLDFPGGDGSKRLADASVAADATGSATLSTPATVGAHTATITAAEWVDVTADLKFADPVATEAEGFQTGTHALLQRLTIK